MNRELVMFQLKRKVGFIFSWSHLGEMTGEEQCVDALDGEGLS